MLRFNLATLILTLASSVWADNCSDVLKDGKFQYSSTTTYLSIDQATDHYKQVHDVNGSAQYGEINANYGQIDRTIKDNETFAFKFLHERENLKKLDDFVVKAWETCMARTGLHQSLTVDAEYKSVTWSIVYHSPAAAGYDDDGRMRLYANNLQCLSATVKILPFSNSIKATKVDKNDIETRTANLQCTIQDRDSPVVVQLLSNRDLSGLDTIELHPPSTFCSRITLKSGLQPDPTKKGCSGDCDNTVFGRRFSPVSLYVACKADQVVHACVYLTGQAINEYSPDGDLKPGFGIQSLISSEPPEGFTRLGDEKIVYPWVLRNEKSVFGVIPRRLNNGVDVGFSAEALACVPWANREDYEFGRVGSAKR